MLRLATDDPAPCIDECLEQARRARESERSFFQIYVTIADRSPETGPGDAERTWLVRTIEAEGWTLDDVGYVSDVGHDGYVGLVTVTERSIAAIYTFRRDEE